MTSVKSWIIGHCTSTAKDLIDATTRLWTLTNECKPSGTLNLLDTTLETEYSYLDFIRGGCELSLIVAIDFTASNKDARDPTSLHFHAPGKLNPYQQVLTDLGSVLEEYDSDKRFPVLGFGAKVDGELKHCFQLTQPDNLALGVTGILDAYASYLPHLTFSGPTNLGPVLAAVVDLAKSVTQTQFLQKYFVLLVLMDGPISDMDVSLQG